MITASRPGTGVNTPPKNAATPPAPCPADPIDTATHLWGLRLWMLCALVIVAFAVCNWLLNWGIKYWFAK